MKDSSNKLGAYKDDTNYWVRFVSVLVVGCLEKTNFAGRYNFIRFQNIVFVS